VVIEYTTKQDVLHHKKEDSFERRERKEGNNFYMKITHWLENITISQETGIKRGNSCYAAVVEASLYVTVIIIVSCLLLF
jgi:hypothetical protein